MFRNLLFSCQIRRVTNQDAFSPLLEARQHVVRTLGEQLQRWRKMCQVCGGCRLPDTIFECFQKYCYPQIIHFNRVFHHPFWGTPIFGNTRLMIDSSDFYDVE